MNNPSSEEGSILHNCPVDWNIIDTYLEILTPAYEFNLRLQRSNCSIGEVVPSICALTHVWQTMETTTSGKKLCDILVNEMNKRFSDELNSETYLVILILPS